MRVHELAKKLGINSKQLIAQVQQGGVDVKNHMSVLPQETIDHYLQVATSIKNMPKAPSPKPVAKKKAAPAAKIDKETPVATLAEGAEKVPAEEVTDKDAEAPATIDIMEGITLQELAQKMNMVSSKLIKHLMAQGHMFTVNQTLDIELAGVLAEEFGFKALTTF